MTLCELTIQPAAGPMAEHVARWIETATMTAASVDCFDYVPSCAACLYGFLQVVPAKSYCEWGSGIGIGVGLASSLGMKSLGIEINVELVEKSRALLDRFGFDSEIHRGDFLTSDIGADVVFVYCWPSQINAALEHFASTARHASWLLLADGAERIKAYYQNTYV